MAPDAACIFQKERGGQREGLGNSVFNALNPCPETMTLKNHWAKLLTNNQGSGVLSVMCPFLISFFPGNLNFRVQYNPLS